MGTLYIDTGGSATNSGSTDTASPTLSGTNNLQSVVGTTVTLPAGTDTTAVDATAGSATQSTIYLAAANNSNTKIFWITGKAGSGGASPTVTVSVAPTTGSTFVNSSWSIGGQHVLTNASIEAALRAGDTVIFNNSPAAQSATVWTFRNAGDSTSGYAKIKGKAGTRPVLTANSTNSGINGGTLDFTWVENLEIVQQGASGNGIDTTGIGMTIYNVKISDAGASGISCGASGLRVISCEITGTGGSGILRSAGTSWTIIGCYIHDCASSGILSAVAGQAGSYLFNIIDTCADRGILLSGATTTSSSTLNVFVGNTVYGCGNSGLEISDADTPVLLMNNIFQDNGDAAGEYNIEWAAGTAELISFHAWNDFFKSSNNLSGLTVNAQVSGSEITTDPLFFNAASGDFRIAPGSPAIGIGYPGTILGQVGAGSIDLGALQSANRPSVYLGRGRIKVS